MSWRFAVLQAAVHGRVFAVVALLGEGCDPSARGPGGWSAAHYAAHNAAAGLLEVGGESRGASRPWVETIKALLGSSDKVVGLTDDEGRSILMITASMNATEVAICFILPAATIILLLPH
jgi:ankyrin repeat protein